MATLSRRQKLLFTDRVNLWKPVYTQDASGTVTETYTLAYSNIPCFREVRDSVSVPTPAGRMEEDILFTQDMWHFAEAQEIDERWVIKYLTAGDLQNTFWMCRGEQVVTYKQGNRDAGNKTIKAPKLAPQDIPPGIS